MHSHHHHGASCHHHPAPRSFDRAFAIGIGLNGLFVMIEALYGWRAHSLALLADAAHNLGDVLGLVLAWLGYRMAQRAPNDRFTFGFGRASIYTTVFNGAFLVASSAWIVYEAILRWHGAPAIDTTSVGVVAFLGIVVNTGTALTLRHGHHDINIKGAWLHMLGDAAVSAAVVLSAVAIHYTGWTVIDPLLSIVLAVLVGWMSWPLLSEGLRLAMDGVPRGLDVSAIRAELQRHSGVAAVHDLRVWALSTTHAALSAHVILEPTAARETLLPSLITHMRQTFALGSLTLQLENDHGVCAMP